MGKKRFLAGVADQSAKPSPAMPWARGKRGARAGSKAA